ncbi:protein RIC-3-like [Dunckerocampus dactyliophorus]|uniref:protein RIC-3-like n=1 Tax=Dunckerocampus dactyliophorus TaxID=161453 RepID=UPI00240730F6|nr:protein RIC-3-like [Dunckerocampus dactyliophorus]
MVMSTFQKVTLATCLVLCVALLLPKMLLSRGRKDADQRPEGGHFPPMVHRQMAPEGRGQRATGSSLSRAHNTEAIARAKGAGPGAGPAGKSNLAGQIIPVYGFGILLYILYILFKITSKGSSQPSESRMSSARSENMKRKITDFELAQLQEKLRETELVMENIVSNAQHSPDRECKGVTVDQEESLLQQLTEITRVMQEGHLVESVAPHQKTNQKRWEDDEDGPDVMWERPHCCCQRAPQSCGSQDEAEADDRSSQVDNVAEAAPSGGQAVQSPGGDEDLETEQERHLEQKQNMNECKEEEEEAGQIQLDVPNKELLGVLQELEVSLKMTSAMELEKVDHLIPPGEMDACGIAVRRRNKRRRRKKESQ